MRKVQRLKLLKGRRNLFHMRHVMRKKSDITWNLFHWSNEMPILHLKDGIIAGMVLGDGHLIRAQRALSLVHCIDQLHYLQFKISLANQLGFSGRCFRNTIKRTNLGLRSYCSGSITGSDISKYYAYTLPDLLQNLNPLGLLLWWLDDGCLSIHHKQTGSVSRFGYLNTQGYGLDGNSVISQILLQKFGLETTIHIDAKSGFAKQDHYRLYLNAINVRRLIDLVREFIPWIPKNMLYKLNMQYVINQNPESPYLAAHYNF